MICSNCQNQYSDEFNFCPVCGQIDSSTQPDSLRPVSIAHQNISAFQSEPNQKSLDNYNEDMNKTKKIFAAIINPNLEELDKLIREGYNINCTDPKGRTPLMIAAFKGHVEIIRLLLDNGAIINRISADGQTAIKLAEKSGNRTAYNIILRKIEKTIKEANNSNTYISETIVKSNDDKLNQDTLNNDVDENTLKSIDNDVDDFNDKSTKENQIFQSAKSSSKIMMFFYSLILFSLIISFDNFINKPKTQEQLNNELVEAIKSGNTISVKSLLKEGANVNYQSYKGYTPLILSAIYGKTNILNILIDAGANPNINDQNGQSPLAHSLINKNNDCIKILIEKGASFNPADDNFNEIYNYSLQNNDIILLNLCVKNNKNLESQVYNYYIDKIKSYYGADNIVNSAFYAKLLKELSYNSDELNLLIEDAEVLKNKSSNIIQLKNKIAELQNDIQEMNNACYYEILYLRAYIVAALKPGVYEIAFSAYQHAILKTVDTDFTTTGMFEMRVIRESDFKNFPVYRESTRAEREAFDRKNNINRESQELIYNKRNELQLMQKELEPLIIKLNEDIARLKEKKSVGDISNIVNTPETKVTEIDDNINSQSTNSANILSDKDFTDLFVAALDDNVVKISQLAEKGVDLNYVDARGYTALHIAISTGKLNAVKQLINLGANINLNTTIGTPIKYAKELNNLEIYSYLESINAKLEKK